MKVSKNWLSDYIDLSSYSDEELFKEINAHVCEIESYKKLVDATNLTIAKVLDCQMHPNSDHLHICQVEIRPNEVSQIVCGAPNVTTGVKVICALPGAVLPGNFKIKPSKIRGVESNGMLCSLQELGIEEKYVPEEFKNGIYLFNDDAPVGDDPLKYLGFDDTIIDLELTSNRSDLLSIEGVAYDMGATLNKKITPHLPLLHTVSTPNPINVKVETDKCYKYNARYVSNVTIKESPQWMKARLISSGIRPINNVVDITNYVLIEMGQPLHAFDADSLGNTIVVRQAHDGEKLKTLDTIERELNSDDIVITNGKDAICVAGVMGGLSTEVESTTKNIVLEGAYFDPLSIRKTSTKLGLKSESSIRYERNIDYDRVERALDYAAELMEKYADATVYEEVKRDVRVTLEPKYVSITTKKINSVLGTELEDSYIDELFNRLAYEYKKNGEVYEIKLPSRRMDLEESPQDIIEDVARMYGYNNIPTTIAKTRDKGYLTYSQKRTRLVRQILAFMGLNEVVSYSLIAKKDLGLWVKEIKEPVEVLMPLTEDRAVMRQSLLNGVVDAIQYNKARKIDNLALFEIGNVYSKDEENLHLAIALSGVYSHQEWKGSKQISDFFLLKGILESLFSKLNFEVSYKPYNEIVSFHPGRCAEIIHNGHRIGIIGEIHPKVQKELGVEGSNISLFDVYTGENVGKDEKSLAFKLTFEDSTKTLETQEVDNVVKNILDHLAKEYNARLR